MNDTSISKNPESDTKMVFVKQAEAALEGDDTSNEEEITTPFDPSKIRVETKNTQMEALIKRMKHKEIDMAPDFQRQAGVWTEKTMSRLIESMLIKIPLPAFYVDASDDDDWLIVDGLQRLTTINRFVIKQDLALTGLEFLTDYNNKYYKDLPRNFKRRIDETDIVIYQIQPGTPHRVKFDIFRRINTGGSPLSAQEIRHALNQGPITEMLKTLASSTEFKEATDYGVSAKRMDDRECVIRFLAFSLNPAKSYAADSFDQFLNAAMENINKMDKGTRKELSTKFLFAMTSANKVFGDDAFRKRYEKFSGRHPINKALFEAWSVALGALTQKEIKILIKKRTSLINKSIKLMNNYDFQQAISQGTGSNARVKLRFGEVDRIIKESLSC